MMVIQVKKISPDQVKERLDVGGLTVIDVRSDNEFKQEHLAGAINVPLDQLDTFAPKGALVKCVLYCRGGLRTSQAEGVISRLPYEEIFVLDGGVMAWKKAGYETVKRTTAPIDIMRQVQLIAGGLVVLGVGFGTLLDPGFYVLAGFVGMGLLFAGLTGFCGMARLLSRMPWNKVRLN